VIENKRITRRQVKIFNRRKKKKEIKVKLIEFLIVFIDDEHWKNYDKSYVRSIIVI
jgi:hypothetical protein